ncbi:AAA family ATPase [Acinetobacter dispersus]|uniref:ATP-dependent nuclease n=1 Tax=Acinetobacter dispersus TaxID=70348 RepID=UPI001F4ABB30|nr:AAA family ATPase [Acinetobacter dispersus]MCH7382435.1 AAA family ATPase [Acinetobacter dispersus]
MKLLSAKVRNYRKLKNVEITFDDRTTVIVGRNNTGKTSIAEIFRSFLSQSSPRIRFEDFSQLSLNDFKNAFGLFKTGSEELIRSLTPSIDLELVIDYTDDANDYGILGDFIIDLDEKVYHTKVLITYRLKDGEINSFYEKLDESNTKNFILSLKKQIYQYYESVSYVIDPTNDSNRLKIDISKIKQLLLVGLVNAQRGLDDETHSEKDVLGKSLGKLFNSANNNEAPEEFKEKSKEINSVVDDLQVKVDGDFQNKVAQLLPKMNLFGYPGLGDTQLSASTELNVKSLLESHTRVYYQYDEDFSLPETYNGLGVRNLIFILFRIYEYFREFQSQSILPKGQIIFIEEPEAHLHPQMQEVFISQLDQIVNEFQEQLNNNKKWPIQFIVSTHSSHIANKTDFSRVRYFLSKKNNQTQVKNLNETFRSDSLKEDKEFLQKYLTLTKCDLYFADLAILIEGATERILLPEIMRKVDETLGNKLSTKYLSIVEVGGAYAHHFYKFLDFLELKTLIITDLDSSKMIPPEKKGDRTKYPAYPVSQATHSTNAGLKYWFKNEIDVKKKGYLELKEILDVNEEKKIQKSKRIAFQIPEKDRVIRGRSFEDAFILANLKLFQLDTIQCETTLEQAVFDEAKAIGDESKANFAIEYAIDKTNWAVPAYLIEGLVWLVQDPIIDPVTEVVDSVVEAANDSEINKGDLA